MFVFLCTRKPGIWLYTLTQPFLFALHGLTLPFLICLAQVSRMLGVKQPTAPVAAVLLKYGVETEHFCYARFLKLSRCVLICARARSGDCGATVRAIAGKCQLQRFGGERNGVN